MERTAAVQPAKLHGAFVARARTAGAEVRHRTRATRLERRGQGFLVQTARGTITAGDVLVAANAYVDGVLPALEQRVLPLGSFIIAPEPLAPERARSVMPGDRMCFDTKHLLNYWRLSPDRRMVFGGRASYAAAERLRPPRSVLYAEMVRVHPRLRASRSRVGLQRGGDARSAPPCRRGGRRRVRHRVQRHRHRAGLVVRGARRGLDDGGGAPARVLGAVVPDDPAPRLAPALAATRGTGAAGRRPTRTVTLGARAEPLS
jgi:hypothetical protein